MPFIFAAASDSCTNDVLKKDIEPSIRHYFLLLFTKKKYVHILPC